MRSHMLVTAIGAAMALVFAAVAVAGHQPGHPNPPGQQKAAASGVRCVLNTQMRAALEPPVLSTAMGHAQLKVWRNGKLSYNVFILNRDSETFLAGHIHLTATAAITQDLFTGPSTTARQIRVKATVDVDPALATGLCTSPSSYYVNFHTTADPVGAVRGNFRG